MSEQLLQLRAVGVLVLVVAPEGVEAEERAGDHPRLLGVERLYVGRHLLLRVADVLRVPEHLHRFVTTGGGLVARGELDQPSDHLFVGRVGEDRLLRGLHRRGLDHALVGAEVGHDDLDVVLAQHLALLGVALVGGEGVAHRVERRRDHVRIFAGRREVEEDLGVLLGLRVAREGRVAGLTGDLLRRRGLRFVELDGRHRQLFFGFLGRLRGLGVLTRLALRCLLFVTAAAEGSEGQNERDHPDRATHFLELVERHGSPLSLHLTRTTHTRVARDFASRTAVLSPPSTDYPRATRTAIRARADS